jgi:hypothetical protein
MTEPAPATLGGTKPESVAALGLPANVAHILDLGVLVSALLVAARWLRQGRAWGYVLPGVLFVKLASIGLAVLGMLAWMGGAGESVTAVEVAVLTVLTLANAAFGAVYLRAMRPLATDAGHRSPVPER